MLIAVSVKNTEESSLLSDSFGRSKYFLIYDSLKNKFEFIKNPYYLELGGAGIQTARFLIEQKVEAVITTFIGPNILRFFNSSQVKVYKSVNKTLQESLKLFFENKLDELTKDINLKRQRRRSGWESKHFNDTEGKNQNKNR